MLSPPGQEDTKVDIEDGQRFTPFNMKEELEEGHFDKEGTYIFKKDVRNPGFMSLPIVSSIS